MTDGARTLWREVEALFIDSYSVFSNKQRHCAVPFCLEMVHIENDKINFKGAFTYLAMLQIQLFKVLPFWGKH